jgi:hypothetical protein
MDSIRPWSVTKLDVHHPGALVRTDPNERIHAGWILRLEQHAQRMRLRAFPYAFSHIVNSEIPSVVGCGERGCLAVPYQACMSTPGTCHLPRVNIGHE